MTDNNQMEDTFSVELNPEPADAESGLPSLPERPSDSATKSEWVDYVEALGAERRFVEEDTEHWEGGEDGNYALFPKFSKDDLIALANQLGG